MTTRDGAVTGVALASGEEIAAPAVVSGPRSQAAADDARGPGDGRAVDALARRQHPDAGHGRQGQPRARRAARVPGRRRRPAEAPRPDPGRHDVHRRRGARVRRLEVRPAPGVAGARGDDPVARGPVAGRRRARGHAGHERAHAVDAAGALRRASGRGAATRSATSRSGRSRPWPPGWAPGSRRARCSRRPTSRRSTASRGGHPLHAEPALDSFFLWRPLLGWARYRMPVEGLYLAGSGAHPGGGVTGDAGPQRGARGHRGPQEAAEVGALAIRVPPGGVGGADAWRRRSRGGPFVAEDDIPSAISERARADGGSHRAAARARSRDRGRGAPSVAATGRDHVGTGRCRRSQHPGEHARDGGRLARPGRSPGRSTGAASGARRRWSCTRHPRRRRGAGGRGSTRGWTATMRATARAIVAGTAPRSAAPCARPRRLAARPASAALEPCLVVEPRLLDAARRRHLVVPGRRALQRPVPRRGAGAAGAAR